MKFGRSSLLFLFLCLLECGQMHERVMSKTSSSWFFSFRNCDISIPCSPCPSNSTIEECKATGYIMQYSCLNLNESDSSSTDILYTVACKKPIKSQGDETPLINYIAIFYAVAVLSTIVITVYRNKHLWAGYTRIRNSSP